MSSLLISEEVENGQLSNLTTVRRTRSKDTGPKWDAHHQREVLRTSRKKRLEWTGKHVSPVSLICMVYMKFQTWYHTFWGTNVFSVCKDTNLSTSQINNYSLKWFCFPNFDERGLHKCSYWTWTIICFFSNHNHICFNNLQGIEKIF